MDGAVAGSWGTSQGTASSSLCNQRREINPRALWMGTWEQEVTKHEWSSTRVWMEENYKE